MQTVTPSFNANTSQWIRKWQIIVTSSATGEGSVLTQSIAGLDLRCVFTTQSADIGTPGICILTVYNLADATAKKAVAEFDKLLIQGGYQQGAFGTIFDGTIKQFERGHESQTESYLRIFASDWDTGFIHATVNTTLDPQWTPETRRDNLDRSWAQYGITPGYRDNFGGINFQQARSRVLFGANVDEEHDAAATANQVWSIEDGKLKLMNADRSTYVPGPAYDVNARSGMIGFPRSTTSGIEVTVLLNPIYKIGGLIRINNNDINQVTSPFSRPTGVPANVISGFPGFADFSWYATVTDDGVYRIMCKNAECDSRGAPWFYHLTCLAIDLTSSKQATGASAERQQEHSF